MKAAEIDWDADGEDPKEIGLPEEMDIPEGMTDVEEISNYITEQTGYCHYGFSIAE